MAHISIRSRHVASVLALILSIPMLVEAAEPVATWLQTRDQNPFALVTGLPLTPSIPQAGHWQFDATFNVANTELEQFRDDSSLLFDAESHESRISAAYAFNDRWSLRASAGYLSIGDGFLDAPIERFHRAFGFDNGDRRQRDTPAPELVVRSGNETVYALDHGSSASGPLLVDLTRHWVLANQGVTGISLGTKFATGSVARLTDSDSTDVSLSAFAMTPLGVRLTIGLRAGVLLRTGNRLLADQARDQVPFAGLMLRYRIGENWSAWLQSDAHAALYRRLPGFLGGTSNQLNFGLSRRIGEDSVLQLTMAEDLPALHSSDVAFTLNWRLNPGR